jgi:hypothetical protein
MNGLFQKAGRSRKSTDDLKAAFEHDGFGDVEVVYTPNGRRRGICAKHKTARNYKTKERKKAYYVEGKPAEMGYLIGLMAHKDVERMTEDYTANIVFDFFKVDLDDFIKKPLGKLLAEIALNYTYKKYSENRGDIPKALIEEMLGIVKGCQKADPNTKVTFKKLLCLNSGADTVMSVLYPRGGLLKALKDLLTLKVDREVTLFDINVMKGTVIVAETLLPKLEDAGNYFRIPIMCNGMSVFGDATAILCSRLPASIRIPLV